jgi:two-component sensor histidine kinase
VRRSRFLTGYFIAWVPIAALYTALIYFGDKDRFLSGAITGGVQSTLTAAVLGLAVWVIATRLADRARPIWMLAAVHVGLAVLYSAAWSGLILLSIWLFAPQAVFKIFVDYALGWNFLTGLFFYGVIAGIAHAVAVTKRLVREREATAKAESLRARAELAALRAQMNPHFLFNTLNSIAALIRSEPSSAEAALERLATLLRRVLDATRGGSDQWALAEEWDIVRAQLELEKLRFGDRLIIDTAIENDALDCQIPVFTLQPLVENAIRHGVAAQTAPCTVRIMAHVRSEKLMLGVTDNGPGADLEAVRSAPGLGIRSIAQRLATIFGTRAHVQVDTERGHGFLVGIAMPAIESPVPSREYQAVTA